MTAEHDLSRVEELFQAAADLPPDRRPELLDRECAGDPSLRRRLERMLAELESGDSLGPAAAVLPPERPGTVIGRYELVHELGDGGFGVVYLARQREPVVREVALKVLRLGMDTAEVVARFEAERQALALMDHPNIAKVLDGGATASGRPYFVMELVEGQAITEYCDERRLSPRERLELFERVCDAVHHAHQKGVLHRDIKPSNVLVAERDGRPDPKVIDFGIAKAIHAPLTERTLRTGHHRFLGTPAYMSPEQADAGAQDVDTRTDVYSLGVLLYELLTGSTPFESRTLLEAGLGGLQRILREDEPPRPSTRVTTSSDAEVAARRRLDPPALGRALRGDLDWIVMKALEKDRERRYGAASELGADVARHLRDEPVVAGPPSATYRMRKLLARNRVAVAWGILLLAALVAGIVGTSLGMVEAGRQRDDARREADHARRVTDFLVRTLALSNPEVAREPDLSVGRLLERTAADVEEALVGDPWAEARVRGTIGLAFDSLGRNEQAEAHLRRAAELMDELAGFPRDELYTVLWSLTHVLFRLERPDAFATAMEARRVAIDHVAEREPELAGALSAMVVAAEEAARSNVPGALEPALPVFEAALAEAERSLAPGDPLWPVVADTCKHAGYTLWYSSHEAGSAVFWEAALAIEERERDPNDPVLAETLAQLVGVLNRAGRAAEAEARVRRAVDAMREVYPEGNFQLCFLEAMLGENLVQRGLFAEAEPHLLRSHAGLLANVGEDSANFYALDSFGRVIALYAGWGREGEAERYRRELLRLGARARYLIPWSFLRACVEGRRAHLLVPLDELARICGAVTFSVVPGGVEDEALPAAVDGLLAAWRPDPGDVRDVDVCVARQLAAWSTHLGEGRAAEEARLLDAVLAVLSRADQELPLDRMEALAARAELHARAGEPELAARLADAAWATAGGGRREDDWIEAAARTRTARSFLALGQLERAEALLGPSVATMEAQLGAEYADVREALRLRAELAERSATGG